MTRFIAGSLLFLVAAAPSRDYAQRLSGKRLVMKDTACAGLAFTDKDTVELYAEMGCVHLEARLRWLAPDTFVLTETERINKDCPPRNWIYKVEALTAKTARLREIWTGWNTFPDSVVEYRVTPVTEDPEP